MADELSFLVDDGIKFTEGNSIPSSKLDDCIEFHDGLMEDGAIFDYRYMLNGNGYIFYVKRADGLSS